VHSLFPVRRRCLVRRTRRCLPPSLRPAPVPWPPAPRGPWGLSVRVPSPLCVVGPHGSSRSGVDANFFTVRDARTTLGWFFGRLAVELALYVRALRPGANGRPPLLPPNLDTTRVVICTVSCLNGRLPLAERAVVRSDLGSGLALESSCPLRGVRARRCPKLQKTCVLLVWMRSVDDWPLARIRTRFPGASRGR